MIRIYPLIFILLWSSAFITTKPIVDNSDPFAALAFRFFFVALGFCLFSFYLNQSLITNKRKIAESVLSGVLFHGVYLGGVFYSINILPDIWRSISMANPMLYVVNTFREGMLGVSDVSISFALSMIVLFIIILASACLFLLHRGTGTRQ